MEDKFAVRTIIRDDGVRLEFDEKEIYLSADNILLNRPEINSTDVDFTDVNGGEMIYQKLPPHEQPFNGLIFPKTSNYWNLYTKISGFFRINHNYKIIYRRKSGELFAQHNAWLIQSLQIDSKAREDYAPFSVGFKIGSSSLYEYAEDDEGNETYANKITLPLLSAAAGGEEWDDIGLVYDGLGEVWSGGGGGVQNVHINSVLNIYPVWTVIGECVNPSLQNNTTDSVARYNGTVAEGQTLVVDFVSGEARLDGVLVSRNITGQVSCKPGDNIMGFNSEGGSATLSIIEWNNVIG